MFDITAQDQLDRIVALVRDVLGADALGAYLHGSAVLGGLRAHSDLDLLVIARRATTPAEKRRLIDGLLAISSGFPPVPPKRPVELTIVDLAEVRPWRYPPTMDLQFGEWFRADFERGTLEPWERTNPDLAPLLAMVRLGDRPLFGPPPADLLDPIPHRDLIHAIAGDLDMLLGGLDSDETRFVVLTLARVWHTVATGGFAGKDAAADWALPRLPPELRPVLARARAAYLGEQPDRWDDLRPRLRPYADFIVPEITRLTAPILQPAQRDAPDAPETPATPDTPDTASGTPS